MADKTVPVDVNGLRRLRDAVEGFARAELDRMVTTTIDAMKRESATGTFDDVAARHQWDEYCWAIQEGPFDDDIYADETNLGSLSGAWQSLVEGHVRVILGALPKHVLVFLSKPALDAADVGDECIGAIFMDGVVAMAIEAVNERASARSLALIGPDRAYVAASELSGWGAVWSALSEAGEASDLVSSHIDALLDPDGDLDDLADELAAAFLAQIVAESEGAAAHELIEHHGKALTKVLIDAEISPMLADMRAVLMEMLDE